MSTLDKSIQEELNKQGFGPLLVDGVFGDRSQHALKEFQKLHGLKPDGVPGPKTLGVLFPAEHHDPVPTPDEESMAHDLFDPVSAKRLLQAEPGLQRILLEARKQATFIILDAQRGRATQERAFRLGHSKVHFGDSAHNWNPSVAVDLAPWARQQDVDWDQKQKWVHLFQTIIMPITERMKLPCRWLGDPNRDGNIADGWDFPHLERHPWREFAKHSRLFGE